MRTISVSSLTDLQIFPPVFAFQFAGIGGELRRPCLQHIFERAKKKVSHHSVRQVRLRFSTRSVFQVSQFGITFQDFVQIVFHHVDDLIDIRLKVVEAFA